MSFASSHDLAQRDLHRTGAVPAFEPGADIGSIGRALGEIDNTVHAAAPAKPRQLEPMPEKVAECLEVDSVVGHVARYHDPKTRKSPATLSGSGALFNGTLQVDCSQPDEFEAL